MKKLKYPRKRKTERTGRGVGGKEPLVLNRNHKDTLFRFVFKDKSKLLKLYNALNDTDYRNEEELVVTTLEDVIYMGYKNDVSCLLDYTFFLGEHQSTWNPNMCLRGLIYFARLYRNYAEERGYDLYGRKRIQLPCPQYYVFYNGEEERPERTVLYLSDSFPEGTMERLAGTNYSAGRAAVDCCAGVLNINYGKNRRLMEQCRPLMEYARFIQYVREEIGKDFSPEDAVGLAVDRCLKEGVLEDILRVHRKEVVKLFLSDYDQELHERCTREYWMEEVEEARKKAAAEGADKTRKLLKMLQEEGRQEELNRALTDEAFFEKLLRETEEKQ